MVRRFRYALVVALLGAVALAFGPSCSTDSGSSTADSGGGGGARDLGGSGGGKDGAPPAGDSGSTKGDAGSTQADSGSTQADAGTPKPPVTKTFSVVADAYVNAGNPSTNYGTAPVLETDQSPDRQIFLRFAPSGIDAAVRKAVLRLTVIDRTSDGPRVHVTANGWTETGINWSNKPAPSGAALADLGSIGTGVLEIDVTAAVKGNGALSFVLVPTSTDGADFSSKEGSSAPELVVTYGGTPGTGPVPSPPPSLLRGPYLQNGSPSAVSLRWRTQGCPVSRPQSQVRYGKTLSLGQTAQSNSTCRGSTTEHEVRLSGLSAKTRYYYVIGTTGADLIKPHVEYHFITSPTAGAGSGPVRIWVLGDSGTANSRAQSVRDAYIALAAKERKADFWLMLGDNAYSDGTDSEYQAAVFDMYPSVLRNRVLWSTRGNHDDHTGNNYYGVFTLPTKAEGGGLASGTESYYSFDYGPVHLVCLNSNSSENRSTTGPMLTWLKNDLASTTQPWIIAFFHHPPYSRGSHNDNTTTRDRFTPILEGGGVDLVLSGHSHAYERSFLINGVTGGSSPSSASVIDRGDGKPTGDGHYQKVAGKGSVYVVAGSSGKISGGSLDHPVMKVSFNNLGSMIIDVNGKQLDARFLRETGAVTDNFRLVKP